MFLSIHFLVFLIAISSAAVAKSEHTFNPLDLLYYEETLPLELSIDVSNRVNVIIPFNKTRVAGSPESKSIRNFIINFYNHTLDNYWHTDVDTHLEKGINYTNLIFTLNTKAEKFIIMSAHYDTKIQPKGFVGGIDSAASCSILLYVSKYIDQLFSTERLNFRNHYGLKIIFFDGEEALDEWSKDDSLYGSRHLATKWEKENIMKDIELFILLDLIGARGDNTIPSYFRNTHKYYRSLSDIEKSYINRINNDSSKKDKINHLELNPTLRDYLTTNQIIIDDDHSPFFERGVPILHLITLPFPRVWHTLDDNFDNISQANLNKWAVMMCEFLRIQLFSE